MYIHNTHNMHNTSVLNSCFVLYSRNSKVDAVFLMSNTYNIQTDKLIAYVFLKFDWICAAVQRFNVENYEFSCVSKIHKCCVINTWPWKEKRIFMSKMYFNL